MPAAWSFGNTECRVYLNQPDLVLMLLLYLFLLAALALFTAYTSNFQRAIVEIGSRIDEAAAGCVMPHAQRLRTMALLAGWPVALGLGMLFLAWWKAVTLVVGAFLIVVPLLGALTPRPESQHYAARIRDDLRGRIARGGRDVEELRHLLERLDRITEPSET